jgi:DNA damage-inducible protein 1
MKQRLADDPNDAEAVAFFAESDKKKRIDDQYRHVVEEYPESLGRVLMLYIEAKINGHVIQAFCDSGAQATIMSKKLATACGIADLIDERMAGVAVGVGTGKILGRIHMVQLQIGNYHFPCSVTVMDDPVGSAKEMPFLLGLDMMKRHTCLLDLERGCLKFRLSPGNFMETPFLHEKDLTAEQGGTRGFDAEKSNQELRDMQQQEEDKMDEGNNNVGGTGSKD